VGGGESCYDAAEGTDVAKSRAKRVVRTSLKKISKKKKKGGIEVEEEDSKKKAADGGTVGLP